MRYFRNTSWLMGENILRMILGLFVGIWVARFLGPEQFGLLSYAYSFVGLFSAIATLGLDNIVIRELVKDEGRRDLLLGTAFSLKICGSLVVLGTLMLVMYFTVSDVQLQIIIIIIAIATVFQSFNVIDFYFRSQVLSRYVVFVNISALLVSSLIKVLLIIYQAPLTLFAAVALLDSMLIAVGFIFIYRKRKNKIRQWRYSKKTALSLLKDSWPLILSGIAISIYMKIDQVMIQEMLGSESVGYYAAAVRLSEVCYFISLAIVGSVFPAVINAKQYSRELYYRRLQKLYNLLVWLAIAISISVSLVSEWVVVFLYGEAYGESAKVLLIHIWASIFVFFGAARGSWLVAENQQYYGLVCTAIGAIINIMLNIILIELYGIEGAAFATLVSYGISSVIVPLFYRKDRISFFMFIKTFNILKFR